MNSTTNLKQSGKRKLISFKVLDQQKKSKEKDNLIFEKEEREIKCITRKVKGSRTNSTSKN